MLNDEQRLVLKQKMDQMRGQIAPVSDEEMALYPAIISEKYIPTSQGDAKIYMIETTKVSEERPLFINIHGGGFIGKRMDRDELFCRKLANHFQALVIDIDYKLAPDYPYPTAVHECQDVTEYLIAHADELRFDKKRIILAGHSSGGNLVAGICMKAGQTGLFKPLCAILDYPPLDLYTDPIDKPRTICDMPAERARMYNEKYVKPECAKDPFVSPVYAGYELLEHFPDTLIISAGEDSLCNEDEQFALNLIRAGVTVTAQRFTESMHGFVINRMCEYEAATALIMTYIAQHL